MARSNIGKSSFVAILHFDLDMQSTLMALNSRDQGHLMTLPKGYLS